MLGVYCYKYPSVWNAIGGYYVCNDWLKPLAPKNLMGQQHGRVKFLWLFLLFSRNSFCCDNSDTVGEFPKK